MEKAACFLDRKFTARDSECRHHLFYDPFSRSHQEYMYAGGQPLRRLSIPSEIWADSMGDVAAVTKIATKAIGYRTDVYCVSQEDRFSCLLI